MSDKNIPDVNMEKLFMFGGSKEFKVEYNVGDCQGGWMFAAECR